MKWTMYVIYDNDKIIMRTKKLNEIWDLYKFLQGRILRGQSIILIKIIYTLFFKIEKYNEIF